MVVNQHRINCGGTAYRDVAGNLWSTDYGFRSGRATRNLWGTVDGTESAAFAKAIMQNTRALKLRNGADLEYSLPLVAPGRFVVTLHFAEIFSESYATGARVFDVFINNQLVRAGFDIVAEAGGPHTHVVVQSTIDLNTATANIRLSRVGGGDHNPIISAIEVDMLTSISELSKVNAALDAAKVASAGHTGPHIEQGARGSGSATAPQGGWLVGAIIVGAIATIAGAVWVHRATVRTQQRTPHSGHATSTFV